MPPPQSSGTSCLLLHCIGISTHHLLNHKPDNLLAKGSKYGGLRGYYYFGTPGVAVGFADDPVHIHNFVQALQSTMPQKKFSISFQTTISSAAQGIPKDWQQVQDLGQLRKRLSDLSMEECFFQLTGLDPAQAAATAGVEESNKKNKKTKGKSAGKKGR